MFSYLCKVLFDAVFLGACGSPQMLACVAMGTVSPGRREVATGHGVNK